MIMDDKTKKNWKLKGKHKVLVPVYAGLFALLALVPSVLLDIYYVQHTTAFQTGKILKFIWLCIASDVVVWGFAATIIVIVSVLVMAVVHLIRYIIETVREEKALQKQKQSE